MSRGMRDMGHCIRNSGIKAPGKALLANFRNRLCEASMRAQDLNRHFAPKFRSVIAFPLHHVIRGSRVGASKAIKIPDHEVHAHRRRTESSIARTAE
jgi:hypothetical protein